MSVCFNQTVFDTADSHHVNNSKTIFLNMNDETTTTTKKDDNIDSIVQSNDYVSSLTASTKIDTTLL
jgi:hypothetical protein